MNEIIMEWPISTMIYWSILLLHVEVSHERTIDLVEFIRRNHQIRDRGTHSQLQVDLIEHLWQMYGQS
ncbi:hypothetical protein RHGRI_000801 [Rhododendron griersonianum]|uniref:Uncharacterized protein n=1 Tax=Rhododendron griersonianum TaxID=479676 RepID=A0AAV6LJ39_9ERIC|nr:hypothetical protein RHGRI_000801 [Rhododendron griersonianum]